MPQTQTQQRGKMNNATTQKPVQVIRYGSLKAAVWKNIVDAGNSSRPMYNVTFSRSYKDVEQWRDSQSFGVDDLLVVAKLANDAHSWIHEQLSCAPKMSPLDDIESRPGKGCDEEAIYRGTDHCHPARWPGRNQER